MALQEVGVEAVVKGLSAFQGDMRSINSSLQGLRGEGTLLQRAFGSVTDSILGFGEHIVRVAEVALGVLLRDAIRAVIENVRELVDATIDAGNEFQILELRLGRLNQGMGDATAATKEQLDWLIKLGAFTAYDPTDIANVFTLARTYGFAADEAGTLGTSAKDLTTTLLDFVSGTAQGSDVMVRLIRNFGQMSSMGKIMRKDLNEMGNAFVPVNRILEIMAEQVGIGKDEIEGFIKTEEAVPAFIKAFSTYVEDTYAGAAEDMAKTFRASVENIKEMISSIGGRNVIQPVLDVFGKRIYDLSASLFDTDRFDTIVEAAKRVGNSLAGIASDVLGLLPSTETIADSIVTAVQKVATWIEANREKIVGFIFEFAQKVGELKDKIVDFVQNKIIPAWNNLKKWFDDNRDVITLFIQAVSGIFSDFIAALTGGQGPAKNFGDMITRIMWFVIENQDAILKWVEVLWSVFIVWQVISTALSIVGGVLLSIAGFVLGLVSAFAGLVGVVNFVIPIIGAVGAAIGAISLPVLALIAAIGVLTYLVVANWNQIKTTTEQLWFIIKYYFGQMWNTVSTTAKQLWFIIDYYLKQIGPSIKSINWGDLGRSIVQGIANGITAFASTIANAARNAAISAYNAAKSALGIQSPSKLFFDIGANTMQGMALGIQKAAGIAAVSMQGAMARVASSAVPSVTNSTVYNNTSNYSLTVNSAAQQEPIVQDFAMMQSLAGV